MIWRALTHNFGWKLASLLISVILWFAIVGEPALVTTHTTPILYQNLPPDLVVGADAVDAVRIELRGPASKLTGSNLSDLAVMLNLADVGGPGERTFTLSDGDVHLPQGVTFLRAVPSQLRLRFARLLTKDVAVHVHIAAPPPAGYQVVREEVTPAQLRIAGPQQRVEETASAQTDAIDLSGATETTEYRVNTFVADPQVRLTSSPQVTVKVIIEKKGDTQQ
jgi:YbbR-like protein